MSEGSLTTNDEIRRLLNEEDLDPHHPFRETVGRLSVLRGGVDRSLLDSRTLLADAVRRLNTEGAVGNVDSLVGRVPYVVLSADIRKSTFLMKEAEDLAEYARVMTSFIHSARRTIGEYGGWFDKFMGDGFLAYWPCLLYGQPGDGESVVAQHLQRAANLDIAGSPDVGTAASTSSPQQLLSYGLFSALSAASLLIKVFESTHKPEFRRGSRNFRADTGLTVGIDIGTVQILPIGQEITIVGHPVVGAVRMTSAGEAGQIVGNSRVGDFAHQMDAGGSAQAALNRRFEFTRTTVSTKEYEQEAYFIAARDSHIRV